MEISLREAQYADLPLMMAWRSNPLVYEGFYQQTEPLKWEEHYNWFSSRNQDWRTLIIEYGNPRSSEETTLITEIQRPVGVVTIGQLDNWSPEVGYYVGEISLWGKGIARASVELAIDSYVRPIWKYCHTTVLDSNERSIRLLKSLGFKYACPARKGESRYEVNLWN